MKSKRLFGLVMSFVMAATFGCFETQVAAVGPPFTEGKVSLSNAFGLLGTVGFGAVSWLLRQKKEERKEFADRWQQEYEEMLAAQNDESKALVAKLEQATEEMLATQADESKALAAKLEQEYKEMLATQADESKALAAKLEQEYKEKKELVARLERANGFQSAVLDDKIRIPEGLNGEGIQLAIDFALGLVETDTPNLGEYLRTAYRAMFDLVEGLRTRLPQILEVLGAGVEQGGEGVLLIHDVDGSTVPYHPRTPIAPGPNWDQPTYVCCHLTTCGLYFAPPPLEGFLSDVKEVSVPSYLCRRGWLSLFQMFEGSWAPKYDAEAAQDVVCAYQSFSILSQLLTYQLERYMPAVGAFNLRYSNQSQKDWWFTVSWNTQQGDYYGSSASWSFKPLNWITAGIKTPAKLLLALLNRDGPPRLTPPLLYASQFPDVDGLFNY
ncbi:MAG: hypothetical protein LBJ38_00320 [Oscillospiraceae bacterium]|jgi:hypothetical protein|nr:hypothetical protein [Oscillospiraceae bacterium]